MKRTERFAAFKKSSQGHSWPFLTTGDLEVPKEGLEPSLDCSNWILNPARLPIPPLRPVQREVSKDKRISARRERTDG